MAEKELRALKRTRIKKGEQMSYRKKGQGRRKERFFLLREAERLPEGMKLLAQADKPISCDSAVISEAKQLLRVKSQNIDANAVLNFTMHSWDSGWFVAVGIPALLVKEDIDEVEAKKKQEAFYQTMRENELMFTQEELERHEFKNKPKGFNFYLLPALVVLGVMFAVAYF